MFTYKKVCTIKLSLSFTIDINIYGSATLINSYFFFFSQEQIHIFCIFFFFFSILLNIFIYLYIYHFLIFFSFCCFKPLINIHQFAITLNGVRTCIPCRQIRYQSFPTHTSKRVPLPRVFGGRSNEQTKIIIILLRCIHRARAYVRARTENGKKAQRQRNGEKRKRTYV